MKNQRRDFIKKVGLGSLLFSTTQYDLMAKEATSTHKPHYGMVFDQNKCVGCTKCEIACNETNHVPKGQHRLFVEDKTKMEKNKADKRFLRISCQQCEDAPCVTVCPTQATHRDKKTDIVDIDKSKCIGCEYCVVACPYKACFINKETNTADRCNFCLDTKLSKGETPACVESCKYDALFFGDLNDKKSYINKLLDVKDSVRIKPQFGTKPSLRYIPAFKRGV